MTNEGAIKWINGRILDLACLVDITSNDRKMERINKEYNALLLAKQAICKQIPEKPETKESSQSAIRHGNSGVYKRTVYSCPRCGHPLYVQHHFEYESESSSGIERWPAGSQTPHCPTCGQALKWEGKDGK